MTQINWSGLTTLADNGIDLGMWSTAAERGQPTGLVDGKFERGELDAPILDFPA